MFFLELELPSQHPSDNGIVITFSGGVDDALDIGGDGEIIIQHNPVIGFKMGLQAAVLSLYLLLVSDSGNPHPKDVVAPSREDPAHLPPDGAEPLQPKTLSPAIAPPGKQSNLFMDFLVKAQAHHPYFVVSLPLGVLVLVGLPHTVEAVVSLKTPQSRGVGHLNGKRWVVE